MNGALELYEAQAVDLKTRAIPAVPRGVRPLIGTPSDVQSAWLGWQWSSALPVITNGDTLGLPAAWRAVTMIANAVAAMAPPRAMRGDLITELVPTPPVVLRPNAMLSSSEFWAMAVAHALTTGNFVGVLADLDADGYPRQVVPLHSESVVGKWSEQGMPEYHVGKRVLTWAEVVHVRYLPVPGRVMGMGPVEAFRRALGEKIDAQAYAANTYRTGAVPSGILKVHRPTVTEEQAADVQSQWIDAHGAGNRKPAILPELFDFTPIAWSPSDVEFLESRKFTVAEVALMFGLDPSDLGASMGGSSLTYANLTQRLAARVVEAYGPWLERFEDAWSDLIPAGNVVRFRRESFVHASRAELITELAAATAAGLLTVDEARAELNLPPLPEPDEPEQPPPPSSEPDQEDDPLEVDESTEPPEGGTDD